MANSASWKKIFDDLKIQQHNFNTAPFIISAKQIKQSCQHYARTTEKEVRILCKQDTRNCRPDVFKDNGLFLLPIKNGEYALIKGEGYIDIPMIDSDVIPYASKLDFSLDTSLIGNSEMQHLDFAYAVSLIRSFMDDPSLVLTIRGRKYSPDSGFSFRVNDHHLTVKSVQTEVDAGYEGKDKIVLIEAKNSVSHNTIIRQLFYPYRQWQEHTPKQVYTLFFEKTRNTNLYSIWMFEFIDPNDYNSIKLVKSARYEIISP